MGDAVAVAQVPTSAPIAFTSRDPGVLRGGLWIDPATLSTPGGAARALKALTDFDAYTAAAKAFLVNLIGRQIAEEPLQGRDGQPTRLGGEVAHAVTVSEVALLQNTSEAVAARTVNFSNALVEQHQALHEALEAGDTTEAHVKVVIDQASTLPEGAAEAFGVEALSRLKTRKGHARTPSELRTVLKALRERLHPESITRRATRARADRGVWLQAEDDGMCTLTALLPAEVGFAVYRRVDAIAQAAHRAEGEYRTKPQLRADALAQALLEAGQPRGEAAATTDGAEAPVAAPANAPTAIPSREVSAGMPVTANGAPGTAAADADAPAAGMPATPLDTANALLAVAPVAVPAPERLADLVRAEIVVHIPAAVLLGASDDVAELEGYGVIDARTARELAASVPTWQRVWTDDDGVPVKLGRTAYRPPESLKRFIRFRDGVCLVPGCSCAARRSEVDHTIEWQDGGTTDADNLALLCPKHHALKSLALFMLRKKARAEGGDEGAPLDGDLVWTTLLGFEHPAEPLERDHILGPRTVSLTPPLEGPPPSNRSLATKQPPTRPRMAPAPPPVGPPAPPLPYAAAEPEPPWTSPAEREPPPF